MESNNTKYKIPEVCEKIYKRRRDLVYDLLEVLRHGELIDIPNLDVNKDIKINLIKMLKDTVIYKMLGIVNNLQMSVYDLEDINIINMVNNSTLARYMGEGFNRNYKLRFFLDTEKEVHEMDPVIELILDDPEKDILDNNKYKYLKTFSMSVDKNYYPKGVKVNNTYMESKKAAGISNVMKGVLTTDDSGITEVVIMYKFLTNLHKIITENRGVDLINKLFKEMRLYAYDNNNCINKYSFRNDLDGDAEDDLYELFISAVGYSEDRSIDLSDLNIEYDEESINIRGMKVYDYNNVSRGIVFDTSVPYHEYKDGAVFRIYNEYRGEVIKREDLEITDSVLDLMANILIYYKLIINE